MIYVGYQGIGKSSIAGENNCVDLESSSFYVGAFRTPDWYKIYCDIAKRLSEQGYLVFLSSHKVVRDELKERDIPFTVIYPDKSLKDAWVQRLLDRYNEDKTEKNYRAYADAEAHFDECIDGLSKEDNKIVITHIDYDLYDLIVEDAEKQDTICNTASAGSTTLNTIKKDTITLTRWVDPTIMEQSKVIKEAIRILSSARRHYDDETVNWAIERALKVLKEGVNDDV